MAEEVIRANRFEVVDGEGRPRVVLGTQGETAGLVLLDGNGESVAELAVGDETGSTSLSLYDMRGSVRASLDLDPEGSPTLSLYDMAGEPRLSLGVDEGNTPVIDLTGPYGEARMVRGGRGLPSLVLMDGDGKDRVSVRVDRRGTPQLELFDAYGRPMRQDE